MNKKFSTLMAGLLVASTVGVNAESLNPSRAYEFRAADVQAAVPFKTVKKIDPNKWYQLRTTEFYGNEALRMPNRPYFGSEVLVHYRDLFTGEVYLRAVPAEEAPLVPSLWRLEYKADGVGGGVWTFINKETGVELTYDPAFANTKGKFNSRSALMVRSCTVNWEWYNTDEQNSRFKEVAPYTYIDDGSNEVMIMQRRNGGYIRALKGTKKDLINNDKAVNALKFQPVEATPITLSEYAFNSMIDANKRTWIQDGAFKFYTPDGNLLNPTEMTPNTDGVMNKDVTYHAEENEDVIHDFFEFAVKDLDGTDSPKEYWQAVANWRKAGSELKQAEARYGQLSYRLAVIEGQKDGLEQEIAILEGEIKKQQPSFDNAYDRACGLAKIAEKFIVANEHKHIIELHALYNNAPEKTLEKIRTAEAYAFAVSKFIGLDIYKLGEALEAYDKDGIADFVNGYEQKVNELADLEASLPALKDKYTKALLAYKEAGDHKDQCEIAYKEAEAKVQQYSLAWDKTKYLLDWKNNFMRLQQTDENGIGSGNYLMVDTAFWQAGANPSNANLHMKHSKPNVLDKTPIAARFYYNLTYWPSQDSLVVEPLNASEISDSEYKAGKKWINSYVGNHFAYASDVIENATQASNSWTNNGTEIALKLEDLNVSGWCLTAGVVDADFDSQLKTRLAFNHEYKHLTRTTLNEGLYTIKATGGSNNGRFLVDNFAGDLMYDVEEVGIQDYNQMPATMWVVEKLGSDCGDLVTIHNREYGINGWYDNAIFTGQLYSEDGGKSYYIVDRNYGEDCGNKVTTERMLTNNQLLLTDDYVISPVTNEEALTSSRHGYGYINPEELKYTNFRFLFNHNQLDKYLNVNEDNYSIQVTNNENGTYYELDTVYATVNEKVAFDEFGYGAGVVDINSGKTLPQLVRNAYVLKVKDVNLIDNDSTYVSRNMQTGDESLLNGYYVAEGIKDIRNGKAAMSLFYLKNDQITNNEAKDTCYALIDVVSPASAWYEDGYSRANVVPGNMYVEYNSLNNFPNSSVSAFAKVKNERPLYREVTDETINLFNNSGEKMFEETVADKAYNYLSFAKDNSKNGALDVERLATDNNRMPQYLLGVARDSIADGYWCNTNKHGYFASVEDAIAAAEDETHIVKYNGYTAGRFLVNFVDSVLPGSHAYHRPNEYTHRGLAVRLGFVEGVHMVIKADEAKYINDFLGTEVKAGEYFFTLVGGHTLADLKNEQGYIIPEKLFNDDYTKMNVYETGKHNNWSFSFRLITDDQSEFLIESNLPEVSSIGSMTGAWIKDFNGCPVVSYIYGNHETIDASNLKKDNVTDGEIFTLEATNDEATANEEISAGNVVVAGVDGAVVVKGAEGKNVIVSTILGKVVANETVSSDNATIAAPQGVVVVSVDGESFKVVVK